jgi:carbon-monoxide dehydrogenase medium subunit
MKPSPFEYHRAGSLDDAFAWRARIADEGAVLAGGQSLLPILNLRLAAPAHVLDVGRLAELGSITVDGAHVRLGACVRQRVAERSAEVASACPLLAEALPWIGHPSTRSRARSAAASPMRTRLQSFRPWPWHSTHISWPRGRAASARWQPRTSFAGS